MTLLPEVLNELHAAAARRARPQPRPLRQRSRLSAAGPLTAAASLAVAAGVAALLLLTVHTAHHATVRPQIVRPAHPAHPAPAPPPGWGNIDDKAAVQTRQTDPGCGSKGLTTIPLFSHATPDPQLRAQLAVLRHPAPATQRVSAAALRKATEGGPARFIRGVYLPYVRRLQRDGITYYLVPGSHVDAYVAPPARCDREQLVAFRQDTKNLAPRRRTADIRYEQTELKARRDAARHPAGACLFITGSGFSGGGGCVNALALKNFTGAGGGGGNNHSIVTAMIVSDRVATATAHYGTQTYPGKVPKPITVTEHVHDNLATFYLHGAFDPPSLTYRAADGTILFKSPSR